MVTPLQATVLPNILLDFDWVPALPLCFLLVWKDLVSLCPFHLGGDLGDRLEESDLMSIEVKIADLGSACWTVSLPRVSIP